MSGRAVVRVRIMERRRMVKVFMFGGGVVERYEAISS